MMIRRSSFQRGCVLFASCLIIPFHSSFGTEEQGAAPTPLPASPLDVHPILVGTRAPDAPLTTVEGTPVGLESVLSGKPTVLVFYRGWW